jgi:peptidyl-prolyl cis-trans isomerase C
MNQSIKIVALVALLSMVLVGCGAKKKETGQVAMKVNGEPIMASDLEWQLEEAGIPPDPASINSKTMKAMIDKEILRQAAIKEKLDQDEKVRARIASADRMILADAYMHKQLAAITKPGQADIDAYYGQHPELYSNRQVYGLQEVALKQLPANVAMIKAKLASGIKFKDFLAWLDQQKLAYNTQQFSASTDRIRTEVVDKLKNVHVGQAVSLESPEQFVVLFVESAQSQPISAAEAAPLIMKRLYGKKMGESMENALDQLRKQAKIEYFPPFTANGRSSDQ